MPYHIKVRAVSISKGMRRAMRNMPRVRNEFANWAKEQADPYVPFKTGALSKGAYVTGGDVIYDRPYAHCLYMGVIGGLKYGLKYQDYRSIMKWLDDDERFHFSKKVHPKAQSHWFWAAQVDHSEEYERKMAELVLKEIRRTRR